MGLSPDQLSIILDPQFPDTYLRAQQAHESVGKICECEFCTYKSHVHFPFPVTYLQIGNQLLEAEELSFTYGIFGCLIYLATLESGQAIFSHTPAFDEQWILDPEHTKKYGGITGLKVLGAEPLLQTAPQYHLHPRVLRRHPQLKRVEYTSTPYSKINKSSVAVNSIPSQAFLMKTHNRGDMDLKLRHEVQDL